MNNKQIKKQINQTDKQTKQINIILNKITKFFNNFEGTIVTSRWPKIKINK